MIAKNEAQVIRETIRSLENEIARYIVCDTGSTDGTQDIVREEFRRIQVPGHVRQHKWKNFGHNRNLCLEDGLKLIGSDCDFWLVLDADQPLVNKGLARLWQYKLPNDAYMIKEVSHGVSFQSTRIFRANGLWEFRGAIHEFVRPKNGTDYVPSYGAFPGNIVYTLHDNISTRDMEDDMRIMEQELLNDPDNTVKWHFHLAKAYGEYPSGENKAIYHFGKTVALSSMGSEERYMSYILVQQILLRLYLTDSLSDEIRKTAREQRFVEGPVIDVEGIIAIVIKARDELEYRYEAWCQIATLYWHQLHNPHSCFQFSDQGIKVGSMGSTEKNTMLATETPMYCLHVRRCVCGFHIGRYGESFESCTKVVSELPRKSTVERWEFEFIGAAQQYLSDLRAKGVA